MAALNRRALAALAVLAGAGCASFVRVDSPRTVPPGQREVLFAASGYTDARDDTNVLNMDLVLRWGVAGRADVGLRFDLLGVATDVKFQLVRAADPSRGVDLAIAPSIGYGADISWTGAGSNNGTGTSRDALWGPQVCLPLLVGINLGRFQLALTPQLLYEYLPVLPAGILNVGGTVAFGRMSGPGFSLYPVIAIWKALDPREPISSLGGPGALAVQPALVFRWGH